MSSDKKPSFLARIFGRGEKTEQTTELDDAQQLSPETPVDAETQELIESAETETKELVSALKP